VHVVESGEYPAKIAREYGMSLNDFLALNKMSSDSTIHEGQEVKVRGKGNGNGGTATAKKAEPVVHTVAKGETASKIAAKYGVKVSDLMAWNNMTEKSVLRVGQECKVYPGGGQPSKGSATASSKQNDGDMKLASNKPTKTHVVARGHNPTSIARQYGVNVSDLYKWNGWSSNHVLQVGDRVKILE
jgi:peptidoglycan endopeptidase LytE